ncbi:hypothetical protein NJC38_02520 [Pseudomonas sp. 21LCFQ010]|uniref:hypothetical protein n=1 Tax=Pseudomonas sp. 21LCFQ010 TaxID=2957506 RepID=UPI00209747A3|nr:hypothetical protein [Pseudomonas sp. 21LCFQ010]MCO8161024.1 hypothetical protein [Pseudomonas sp. 21LCFQ010]
MPEEMKFIGPIEVARDQDGWWYHPDIPDFDEDHDAWKAWLAAQQLKVVGWHMDSDLESHPYWDEDACHCLGWEPKKPPTADGLMGVTGDWFLLGIFDTEDGPYAQWACRVVTP